MYKLDGDQYYLEEVCYEDEHINAVWAKMETMLPKYFIDYLTTENGSIVEENDFEELKNKFKIQSSSSRATKDYSVSLHHISEEAVDAFENNKNDDRKAYLDVLDPEYLEECKSDYNDFKKNDLRKRIPIIRKTLSTNKKELEKYKMDFNASDPKKLLEIVLNIANRSLDFEEYEEIDYFDDEFDFDEDDYTYYCVIGNGIKSHFLYKLNPKLFPNRSKNAIFSLWYLVDKEEFDCKEGSEFLMIDFRNPNKNTTQENYYMPYFMFAHYASLIADFLRKQYAKYKVKFNEKYRFVYVDNFLEYIANKHSDEIKTLKGSYYEY